MLASEGKQAGEPTYCVHRGQTLYFQIEPPTTADDELLVVGTGSIRDVTARQGHIDIIQPCFTDMEHTSGKAPMTRMASHDLTKHEEIRPRTGSLTSLTGIPQATSADDALRILLNENPVKQRSNSVTSLQVGRVPARTGAGYYRMRASHAMPSTLDSPQQTNSVKKTPVRKTLDDALKKIADSRERLAQLVKRPKKDDKPLVHLSPGENQEKSPSEPKVEVKTDTKASLVALLEERRARRAARTQTSDESKAHGEDKTSPAREKPQAPNTSPPKLNDDIIKPATSSDTMSKDTPSKDIPSKDTSSKDTSSKDTMSSSDQANRENRAPPHFSPATLSQVRESLRSAKSEPPPVPLTSPPASPLVAKDTNQATETSPYTAITSTTTRVPHTTATTSDSNGGTQSSTVTQDTVTEPSRQTTDAIQTESKLKTVDALKAAFENKILKTNKAETKTEALEANAAYDSTAIPELGQINDKSGSQKIKSEKIKTDEVDKNSNVVNGSNRNSVEDTRNSQSTEVGTVNLKAEKSSVHTSQPEIKRSKSNDPAPEVKTEVSTFTLELNSEPVRTEMVASWPETKIISPSKEKGGEPEQTLTAPIPQDQKQNHVVPAGDDIIHVQAPVLQQNDIIQEPVPRQHDIIQEPVLQQNDIIQEPVPRQHDITQETVPGQNDSIQEPVPVPNDSIEELVSAQKDSISILKPVPRKDDIIPEPERHSENYNPPESERNGHLVYPEHSPTNHNAQGTEDPLRAVKEAFLSHKTLDYDEEEYRLSTDNSLPYDHVNMTQESNSFFGNEFDYRQEETFPSHTSVLPEDDHVYRQRSSSTPWRRQVPLSPVSPVSPHSSDPHSMTREEALKRIALSQSSRKNPADPMSSDPRIQQLLGGGTALTAESIRAKLRENQHNGTTRLRATYAPVTSSSLFGDENDIQYEHHTYGSSEIRDEHVASITERIPPILNTNQELDPDETVRRIETVRRLRSRLTSTGSQDRDDGEKAPAEEVKDEVSLQERYAKTEEKIKLELERIREKKRALEIKALDRSLRPSQGSSPGESEPEGGGGQDADQADQEEGQEGDVKAEHYYQQSRNAELSRTAAQLNYYHTKKITSDYLCNAKIDKLLAGVGDRYSSYQSEVLNKYISPTTRQSSNILAETYGRSSRTPERDTTSRLRRAHSYDRSRFTRSNDGEEDDRPRYYASNPFNV